MKITAPGLYVDFPIDEYHADPTPEPSFSQSIAKVLLAHSPAHAQLEHPRLRPAVTDDDEPEKYVKARAIGDAAHLLMLGRGKRLAVLTYDDFRKKDAQQEWDEAIARGQTPILVHHHAIAYEMVMSALEQMKQNGIDAHWRKDAGQAEVVIAWRHDGLWCRSAIDWLTNDTRVVYDYKTTGMSAAPQNLGKLMLDAGWPVQSAMHEWGLTTLYPESAGRLRHIFVAQEQYPPYELTVSQLPESTMVMGRKLLARAWAKWRHAMQAGRWDGYPRMIQHPTYPQWAETRILEQEVEEAERERDGGYVNVLLAG